MAESRVLRQFAAAVSLCVRPVGLMSSAINKPAVQLRSGRMTVVGRDRELAVPAKGSRA
jgi:hypothetical protein